jgi:hypothetical protein
MKTAIATFTLQRFLSPTLLAAAFMISFSLSLGAQQPVSNSVDAQREACASFRFWPVTGRACHHCSRTGRSASSHPNGSCRVTEAAVGSNPPHRSVDMELQHQP